MVKSKRMVLFSLSIGFFWFSQYVYVPIFPAYIRDMGVSYEMLGVILGAYGFAQMLLRIPLGIWSDRIHKRRPFIVAGVVFSVVSAAGMWLLPTETGLLLFRGLSGVGAATWVVHTVAFAGLFPAGQSVKAMGIVNAVLNVGQVAAMLVGGLVAYYWGQEYTFVVAAAGGIVGIALSFSAPEAERTESRREPPVARDLLAMLKQPNLLAASGLGFCLQALTYGTVYGFTPVLARQLGATHFELGLLQAVFILPGIAASAMSGGYFSRRFGVGRCIIAGFAVTGAAYGIIPALSDMYGLYLSQIVGGFARGLVFPLLMGLSIRDVDSRQQVSAMGVFQAVYGIGMFLGPVLLGVVSDRAGMEWAFWLAGIFAFASALAARFKLGEVSCKS